jgi:mannose-1-phosphate guanylyltransferase / mannose-6-phosphate isomerase
MLLGVLSDPRYQARTARNERQDGIRIMPRIYPIILAGGIGTRIWPLSRPGMPKQFLPLIGERSLLQSTLTRIAGLPGAAPATVICAEGHRHLVAAQIKEIGRGDAAVLLEPVGRSTAPAAAIAANWIGAADPGGLLLVLPSDHWIPDAAAFCAAVAAAAPLAAEGRLVTFGIVPSGPETGYGYIRAGAAIAGGPARSVAGFIEKPDIERARSLLAAGNCFWNGGIFLFRADAYLAELERHRPDVWAASAGAIIANPNSGGCPSIDPAAFVAIPSISIDYAVMERTDRAAVLPSPFAWSDVGSFAALHAIAPQDEDGNAIAGNVVATGSSGCYLRAERRLLAAHGLRDIVVVETADAVLVVPREQAQAVGVLVGELNRQGKVEAGESAEVRRPWGRYEAKDAGAGFQVKRITVDPGQQLSLQSHRHRAEYWVVVQGTALVTLDDKRLELAPGQSVYIPLGAKHRLANPGSAPLVLIEVQTGDYLGEDDIVRYADDYGRDRSPS